MMLGRWNWRVAATFLAVGMLTVAGCDDADPGEDVEDQPETQGETEAPDEEEVDEAADEDGAAEEDAAAVDGELYSDELHDLDELDVPEPGTAQASLDGEVLTFDVVEECDLSDAEGEESSLQVRIESERDDGDVDRLGASIVIDEDEDVRTEAASVSLAVDDDGWQEGAGHLLWSTSSGLQAGEGEPPFVLVTEDGEFTATGEFTPRPGAGEEMRVGFELAGAC